MANQVSYTGKVRAPEFPPGLEWLNTAGELSLAQLRGKIVLLDFWSYCCINCMHILPDLRRLESKYRAELVVIGVHSGKFTTERDRVNIQEAIERYEIEHPIVNDKDFQVWNSYAVKAWPTVVLIDPEGKVVGGYSGEGVFEPFDLAIAGLVEEFGPVLKRDQEGLWTPRLRDHVNHSILYFPGKVTSDQEGKRLFVSDSNHNRVVVLTLPDCSVADVIGSGRPGLKDGGFDEARFGKPQGLAFQEEVLYVADTDNHAVRAIDLESQTVRTLAGKGTQSRRMTARNGQGPDVELNSPWDLTVHKKKLYIAMAGQHQIWKLDLKTLHLELHAGSGREDMTDGPLAQAALAQPSGITNDGTALYFADSEVSAVRRADTKPSGNVKTIVGRGLFEYGDQDGTGDEVRLQHPIGVHYYGGLIYVVDTYNNKIKKLDPEKGACQTIVGTGRAGAKDGTALEAELNEPNGLCQAGGKFYIADTNNHVIRIYDPARQEVATARLGGIENLVPADWPAAGVSRSAEIVLAQQSVKPGSGALELNISLPAGYELNDQAPFLVSAISNDPGVVSVPQLEAGLRLDRPGFPLILEASFRPGRTNLELAATVYYCQAGRRNLCLVRKLRVVAPVQVEETMSEKSMVLVKVLLDA